MILNVTRVNRLLEKKTQMLGFELFDLFALLVLFSALNLVFSGFKWKLFMTLLPTLIAGLALRFGKDGKPENHLKHLLMYYVKPKSLFAFFEPDVQFRILRQKTEVHP
jgi:hypothetical protein